MYNCPISEITFPNSITEIGNYVFSECSNLESIILPNKLNSLGTMLIENNINLDELIIPSSVTNINLPLIGEACNVGRIETPFIGSSKDKNTTFREFSRTLNGTTYLKINGNLNLTSGFSNGLDSLETLIVTGVISGATSGIFSNLAALKTIRFNGDFNCSFKDLFTSGIELDRVYLATKNKITENYFSGMRITNLAVYQYEAMQNKAFSGAVITNLYIGSVGDTSMFNKEGFYEEVERSVDTLYVDSPAKASQTFKFVKRMNYTEFNDNFLKF